MEEKRFGPVWFIPGERGGRYPSCHSVYIEGAGILIDPGSDRGRLEQLRRGPGVTAVWLSHWHEDHITHLDLFEDVPLYMAQADARALSSLDGFLDAYGMETEEERAYWCSVMTEHFHFKPRNVAGFLTEGTTLHLDGVTLEVVGTPGHTPGHLSFFFPDPGVVLMGDYDLCTFGPWYGDTESSIEGTFASVEKLRNFPARVRLAGHEAGVFEEDPGEAWDRYLNVILTREAKLYAFLERPRTLDEIVGAWLIYGRPREPKPFFEFGERAMMKKHLKRLLDQGRITLTEDRYYRTDNSNPTP